MAQRESPFRFDNTHLNVTALTKWNYAFYETNKTLSNESSCYLAFGRYTPLIFPNGTFANATSCYSPINPIRTRGILALVFGSFYAISILFTLINLRKHGKSYLPREKRWTAVGRRWQWYWMLFVAACGATSCFTAVDVDRDYVLGLPMSLQCFFLTLINPGLNAAVWECVRHWGSFQERRRLDADPFAFSDGDLRSNIEFYCPLVFYLLDWMVFFLTIPRSWTTVQKQRSTSQALLIAAPAATDLRFKAGSIVSVACFILICFSLAHSKKHYRGRLWRTAIPVVVFVLAVRTGYWVASAWRWDLNPFNLETDLGFQYSLDYLTPLSILAHLNVRGHGTENDDKVLIADRAERSQTVVDGQVAPPGDTSRPSWWYRSALDRDRTPDPGNNEDLEMRVLGIQARRIQEDESGSWWWQKRNEKRKDSDAKRETGDVNRETYRVKGSSMLEPEEHPLRRRTSQTQSELSGRTTYSTFDSQPQVVRSMLDI